MLLPGRVLLTRDPPALRYSSGLFRVDKTYADTGHVLLHEPRALDEDLTGKRVVFAKWSGKDFEWRGTTLTVLTEGAVLAVIDKETDDAES